MSSLVTVFGGTGFIGRYVVQKLVAEGCRVRVAVRDTLAAEDLKPLGELGQVVGMPASVSNPDQVRAAVDGADAVINLVGILKESGRRTFDALHHQAAGIVAKASKDAGVKALVQVSALGADADSPSSYARSKAAGEAAVLAAFPKATIIRPSVVFGPEDGFFNLFATIAQVSPVLPYFSHAVPHDPEHGGGPSFQPVYVGDVAEALVKCARVGKHQGRVYELGGPGVYTMREIMEIVNRETCRNRHIMAIPFWFVRMKAWGMQVIGSLAPITPDQVILLDMGNVLGGQALGLADLKIEATPVDAVVPFYLDRFRPFGRQKRSLRPQR